MFSRINVFMGCSPLLVLAEIFNLARPSFLLSQMNEVERRESPGGSRTSIKVNDVVLKN